MRTSLIASALLLGASVLGAQQVTLRGTLENTATTGVFALKCSDVLLSSPTLNLQSAVGQHLTLLGDWNGSSMTPAVVVTRRFGSLENFEIPGNPTIAGTLRFKASANPGEIAIFFASPGAGFLPVGAEGTLLLDPFTTFQAGTGVIGQLGSIEKSVNLPNDAALVGIVAHAQAVIVGPSSFLLSNPDCKPILP